MIQRIALSLLLTSMLAAGSGCCCGPFGAGHCGTSLCDLGKSWGGESCDSGTQDVCGCDPCECDPCACGTDNGSDCGAGRVCGCPLSELFSSIFHCGHQRSCGCGDTYWGGWHSDPAACCDPCDHHGNWIGSGCCGLGLFKGCGGLGLFKGCGGGPFSWLRCGECCDSECDSGCDGCGSYDNCSSCGYSEAGGGPVVDDDGNDSPDSSDDAETLPAPDTGSDDDASAYRRRRPQQRYPRSTARPAPWRIR